LDKQVFIVLRSGVWNGVINGVLMPAERTAVLGAYTDRSEADRVLQTTPLAPEWDMNDVVMSWVEPAFIDEEIALG
jgi:hypothetical protein